MSIIDVVSAVIVRGNRVLLTQRRPDKDFPFCWEAPGGKVDEGETHHEALWRELFEELGIAIGAARCDDRVLWGGSITRPNGIKVFVHFYVVTIWGEPVPREGQGIGWFTEREMMLLAFTPANEKARELIVALLRSRS